MARARTKVEQGVVLSQARGEQLRITIHDSSLVVKQQPPRGNSRIGEGEHSTHT
jgi:hypothetical protein